MKKILAITCLAAVTTMVHAQGWIAFVGNSANITTNGVSYYSQVGGTSGKIASSTAAPGAFDFALLMSSSALTGGASNPSWNLVTQFNASALTGTAGPGFGLLTGPGGAGGVQINAAAGTAMNFLLVGWSTTLGSTWASIQTQLGDGTQNGAAWTTSGLFGQTGVVSATPFATAGAGDPSVFPGMFANGTLTLFGVAPTPEPTTMRWLVWAASACSPSAGRNNLV